MLAMPVDPKQPLALDSWLSFDAIGDTSTCTRAVHRVEVFSVRQMPRAPNAAGATNRSRNTIKK